MFDRLTRRILDPDGALGTQATTSNEYLWDGTEMVGQWFQNGSQTLIFSYGPSADMVLFEDTVNGSLHTLLADQLNTVRDVVSTSGSVQNHLVYTTYGEVKSETPSGYSPFMHFTGKPLDAVTGLQYNHHRWYDAAVGRWISEDPIGFGGLVANLNSYGGNSPVNSTDSTGLLATFQDVETYQARKRRKIEIHKDLGTIENPVITLDAEDYDTGVGVHVVASPDYSGGGLGIWDPNGGIWASVEPGGVVIGGHAEGKHGIIDWTVDKDGPRFRYLSPQFIDTREPGFFHGLPPGRIFIDAGYGAGIHQIAVPPRTIKTDAPDFWLNINFAF